MHELLDSTAIAFVGRHNSGKTTIVCAVIAELTHRGLDVASIKHHGHAGFDIDVPGKDSHRHRAAGASEVVIASPDAIARIRNMPHEVECAALLASMPGHDIVIVEGYRASGLPFIEVMRSDNERDAEAARQMLGGNPPSEMVAVASDMPAVLAYAERAGLPAFPLPDCSDEGRFGSLIVDLCDFLEARYVRPKVTVALQAGGESKRMGESKALVSFRGRPLISHMVRRVLPAADEVVVTTNEADRLAFLFQEFPAADIRLVPDAHPIRGALTGFVTAFRVARHPLVAMVACDMAFASASLLAHQVKLLHDSAADAVVPANRHGFEPLHAVYRRDACYGKACALMDSGTMRLQDFVRRLDIITLTPADVREIAPLGGVFANANTPEELAKMEALAHR